jgi:hypothetical protein
MLRFGVIDQILREPSGGAHRDSAAMISATGDAIAEAFNDLRNLDADGIAGSGGRNFSISAASSADWPLPPSGRGLASPTSHSLTPP